MYRTNPGVSFVLIMAEKKGLAETNAERERGASKMYLMSFMKDNKMGYQMLSTSTQEKGFSDLTYSAKWKLGSNQYLEQISKEFFRCIISAETSRNCVLKSPTQ